MNSLYVQLLNKDGLRLVLMFNAERSSYSYIELRHKAEDKANHDPMHRKYGPWHAAHSWWE
jgi:hypothetical protein